jgi:hypothetical protein
VSDASAATASTPKAVARRARMMWSNTGPSVVVMTERVD